MCFGYLPFHPPDACLHEHVHFDERYTFMVSSTGKEVVSNYFSMIF